MTFYNKVKWILGILMVFVLIVSTNLIDRNNFARVNDSVATLYDDRLVANHLIYEMSKAVQEKEVAVALSDSVFFAQQNRQVNEAIDGFITRFERTKLTMDETRTFDQLKGNLKFLKNSENAFRQSNFEEKDPIQKSISLVKQNLDELSEIQLSEGVKQMSISQRAMDTVELFTQIEIYLLIFLAIVIQIIVMYNPKKKTED